MKFDCFVLLGRSPATGAIVPLGCHPDYKLMEQVMADTAETMRLTASYQSAEKKRSTELTIATMTIMPATIEIHG